MSQVEPNTDTVVPVKGQNDYANFDYKKFDKSQFQDRKFKAEEYQVDTNLRGGAAKKRKCTDLVCAIIFTIVCLTMFSCTIYSYLNGSPAKYMAPIDKEGNMCGFTNNTKGYNFLYLADIKSASVSPSKMFAYGVCVKKCPNGSQTKAECSPESQAYCDKFVTYGSWDLLSYCVPIYEQLSPSQQIEFDNLKQGFDNSNVGSFVLELYLTRWVIVICIFIAMGLSIGYIKLMDWKALWMAWISVVLVWVGLVLIGVCAYIGKNDALVDSYLYGGGEVSKENVRWYKVTYWMAWIFAGLYCLCAACQFHALQVSVNIIQVASDFYGQTKRLIFVPLLYFLIGVSIFVGWLFALACVCSLGNIETSSVLLQSKTVDRAESSKWMICLMIFGMIWIVEFLAAANQFVTICAAADWYFDPTLDEEGKKIAKHADIYIGIGWSFSYQMGTLAFGSLLLTIVDIIRGVFEYMGDKLQDAGANNGCTQCMLKCVKGCLACFDKCLRFINMNAYVYCAIANTPFCESAVHAFLLMLKNSAKFGFVNGIGSMFMFLAKFAVSITTTGIGYGLLQIMVKDAVTHLWVALVLIFLISYFVSSLFISIFDAASNTILQCFILDQEIGAVKGMDEATHVPPLLNDFLEKANRNQVKTAQDKEMQRRKEDPNGLKESLVTPNDMN